MLAVIKIALPAPARRDETRVLNRVAARVKSQLSSFLWLWRKPVTAPALSLSPTLSLSPALFHSLSLSISALDQDQRGVRVGFASRLPSPVSRFQSRRLRVPWKVCYKMLCYFVSRYGCCCCSAAIAIAMHAAIFALLFYERIKHRQQCPCQLFNVSLLQQQQQPQLRLGDCSLPWRICLTAREPQRIICSFYIKLMICTSVVCCPFSTKQGSW